MNKKTYYIYNGFIFDNKDNVINCIKEEISKDCIDDVDIVEIAIGMIYDNDVEEIMLDTLELLDYITKERDYINLYIS